MDLTPETIFAEHIANHERGDSAEEAAFEVLVEANPEQAEELRRLRAAQQRLGAALPKTLTEKTSGLHRPAGEQELPKSAFHATEGATIGDFRLTRLLGRGGMGEVWEAEQVSLSRKVALKLMLSDRVSERGLEFFAREARAGGRLAHKGIVSVFGAGVNEGAHWIAMELVEGACDLKRSFEAMRDEAEVPEGYYEHTAGFIAALADALEVAHQAGVIHRDLKPANILVAADDSPKVADFGLAKLEDEMSISSAGELLGTYYYMSPEQVATKRAGIDHRTDLFSLGVVMYEMLTLVRPFEGDTTEQVAQKILWEEAPDPKAVRSKVPRDLAVICGKAMEKDPGRRYPSMEELAAELRRFLNDEPIQAKPPAAAQRAIKWIKRNPTKSVGGAVAAAAFVAISALAIELQQQGEELKGSNEELALQTAQATESAALATQRAEEIALTNEELKAERLVSEAAREEATQERDLAEQRWEELAQVSDFQAKQLAGVDAAAMGITVREMVLARARAAGERRGQERAELDNEEAALEKILAGADFTGLALDVLEEEIFERALKELEGFEDQPLVQAGLMHTVARTMTRLGLLGGALPPLERALEVYRQELGNEHEFTLRAVSSLGNLFSRLGELDKAETLLREALEGLRRLRGEGGQDVMAATNNLGAVYKDRGDYEGAERLLREALDGLRRERGDEDKDTLISMVNLASALIPRGKKEEAAELLMEALRGFRGSTGLKGREALMAFSEAANLCNPWVGLTWRSSSHAGPLKGTDSCWEISTRLP